MKRFKFHFLYFILVSLASASIPQEKTGEAIILENGKKLKTGVPFPANGRSIALGSPVSQLAGKPRHKATKLNVFPAGKPRITVAQGQVKKIDTKKEYFFTRESGEKIPTGKAIPIDCPEATYNGFLQKKTELPLSNLARPRLRDETVYSMQYYDVDEGLASSYVYKIYQDKKGAVWLGGYNGVNKLEGNTLTHYTTNEGLSSNVVLDILEDQLGNMWFATDGGGVSKFDGHNFYHYTTEEGLTNDVILSLYEDRAGNIWLGTGGGGATKLSGDRMTHYTTNEGLADNVVWSIVEDKSGFIWFATEHGLSRLRNRNFVLFGEKSGLGDLLCRSLTLDPSGNLWCGTDSGLLKYDGSQFELYTTEQGLCDNGVRALEHDGNGTLWIGTYSNGACSFDGKQFTHYTTEYGLSESTVRSILHDSGGHIWFGTAGGGLTKFLVNNFYRFSSKEGLTDDTILSIREDRKHRLWFGSYNQGVFCYKESHFEQFTTQTGLSGNSILYVFEDSKGILWFGTDGSGLTRYDGKHFTTYTVADGLCSESIRLILEDKKGNLWFCSYGEGISRFDGKSFLQFTEKEGLSNPIILAAIMDQQGALWFGSLGGGASKYDGKNFTHYSEKEGLKSNTVSAIFEDHSGAMWFGHYGQGITRFDGKNYTYFNTDTGLSNNIVWSIVEDDKQRLWVGTESGLNCFVPHSKGGKESYEIITFDKLDGLKGLDFYSNSALIDHQNRLWLGSGKGLTMLDLNRFKLAKQAPKVLLKQIEVNEQFIDFQTLNSKDTTQKLSSEQQLMKGKFARLRFDGVAKFTNYPVNLVLPYENNHMSFHFTALAADAPNKLRYRYKIASLNEAWSQTTAETKADYRNLPYGKHSFQVQALGRAGIWSPPLTYSFTILPPWWHTTWFRVLLLLLVSFTLYSAFHFRTAALRARQNELEHEVDLATNELRVKNTEIQAQKEEVELAHEQLAEHHKEITDSINYAKRIQDAMLSGTSREGTSFPDHFVLFKPKDVVSGDFYWAQEKIISQKGKKRHYLYICVADCTGHGVPGAFMSLLGISFLNQINSTEQLLTPAELLDELRTRIIKELGQTGAEGESKDGMDMSLVRLELPLDKNNEINYIWAGANNPLYHIKASDSEQTDSDVHHKEHYLQVIAPDKQAIGYNSVTRPFTDQTRLAQKGDLLVLFTDGYADQFGGERGKKMKYRAFKEMLLSVKNKESEEQKIALDAHFESWKNAYEQVDDVCVIVLRL